MLTLSIAVPTTLEAALAFLQRPTPSEEERTQIVAALNRAALWMEGQGTGRRLTDRTYREPVTGECTLDAGTVVIGGNLDLATIKQGDEATGVGLQPGTFVGINTDGDLVWSAPTIGPDGERAVTFGSAPFVLDGDGTRDIVLPERPVTAVYGARHVAEDGTETAIDITDARIVHAEIGIYRLARDRFPKGEGNIEIDCRCGYRAPTGLDRGHPEYLALQGIVHRLAQCYFQDQKAAVGRVVDKALSTATFRFADFDVPDDILRDIAPFRRYW